MATDNSKKTTIAINTDTAKLRSQVQKLTVENKCLQEKLDSVEGDKWCYLCDTRKSPSEFYASTDPRNQSRITPICKECARKIALRVGPDGEEHEPTKESVIEALRYLDKPFLTTLWHSSEDESNAVITGKRKNNTWTSYIKNVQMRNYYSMTFADSDFFKGAVTEVIYDQPSDFDIKQDADAVKDFEKNRNDVIRLLSYDPFANEDPQDQPLLYSQLLGLLDAGEDSNDDMIRTAACITIVRAFLQQSKIDDATAKMMGNYMQLTQNIPTIKSMQESKKNLTATISSLSKDNCISLQYNKGNRKGENTWTGKIKKIRDLNLREGEVNGFDIDTCRGMRQVMDASHKSLLEQLRLDESEYGEIIAEQRDMVVNANRERDKYKELNRILLRENIDLRDTLKEHHLLPDSSLVDLSELYSPFSAQEEDENEEGS